MQPNKNFKPILLAGILLLFTITVISAIKSKVKLKQRAVPTKVAIAPSEVDDSYYKIPDNITYNGKTVLNKAGLLTLSTETGHNFYLVNDTANNTGFLYAEVKADNYNPTDKVRAPLNISLVIDRSGSMEGDKLAYVKKAADFLIDKLNEQDMLSIVVYETQVGVIQKSAPVSNKQYLHTLIANVVTGGGTNLGGGMEAGLQQVKNTYKSGYVNRVLLLSDGLANEGIVDPLQLKTIVKKWFNQESVSISTFGVGNDYNENLMTSLAENGGGNYYYIKDPKQIPTIFEKEINGLLTLVAKQATLKIKLPSSLMVQRVYGGNYEMDQNELVVNLKDVFANETKAILVKFKINTGTNTDLALTTVLNFEDATQNSEKKELQNLNTILPIDDVKQYLSNFSERVMQQCTMFETNDLMEKTMKAADEGDYDKARKLGITTKGYFDVNSAKISKSNEIIMQDSIVSYYNVNLKDIDQKSEGEIKSIQKVSKSANYTLRTKK
jgi:Ca-activated chloride channel family protein